MKKEYLILSENNEWLSTCETKKEALQELKEFKKTGKDNNGEELLYGYLYLYEARELKEIKIG